MSMLVSGSGSSELSSSSSLVNKKQYPINFLSIKRGSPLTACEIEDFMKIASHFWEIVPRLQKIYCTCHSFKECSDSLSLMNMRRHLVICHIMKESDLKLIVIKNEKDNQRLSEIFLSIESFLNNNQEEKLEQKHL